MRGRMEIRCAMFFLLLFCGHFSIFGQTVGQEAPPFANPDIDNKFHLSGNTLGRNWVILDFFATFCEPCKEAIPVIEGLVDAYKELGLKAYIFATDGEGKRVVAPYFAENPTKLPVLLDMYRVTAQRYRVESIPTTFLINPNGMIAYKAVSYSPVHIQSIIAILDKAGGGSEQDTENSPGKE